MRAASDGSRIVLERGSPDQIRREMQMKFLGIYRTAERAIPPSEEERRKMGKLVEEGMRAGHLLASKAASERSWRTRSHLQREPDGDRRAFHRVQGGDRGLAILRANSKQEASELTKRFLE